MTAATPDPCDSGIRAPAGLSDGSNHYCIAACGYVVRYPATMWDEVGRPALDAHKQAVHPARYERDRLADAMSRD